MSKPIEASDGLKAKAFLVTWLSPGGRYVVDIPNYNGGSVVRLSDAQAAVEAAYEQGKAELMEENAELNHLFDLQHKRMGEATKLWQQETGRDDTWPDLGDLLTWLMARGQQQLNAAQVDRDRTAQLEAALTPLPPTESDAGIRQRTRIAESGLAPSDLPPTQGETEKPKPK